MFQKFESNSFLIGFFMAEMDSTHLETLGATKLCKFDSWNNDFSKFPQDFLKIVLEKSWNSS